MAASTSRGAVLTFTAVGSRSSTTYGANIRIESGSIPSQPSCATVSGINGAVGSTAVATAATGGADAALLSGADAAPPGARGAPGVPVVPGDGEGTKFWLALIRPAAR